MNCKKCGYPLFSNDKFCKNCGEVVEEVNNNQVENAINNGPIAPVINNGPIVDPTVPQPTNNNEQIYNVSLPQVNNGPIAPVVSEGNGMSIPNVDAKQVEPVINYDKIDGPKSVSGIMSMMGTPTNNQPQVNQPVINNQEPMNQGPQLANVNQGLPSLPNEQKSSNSVIIPTKPKANNEPVNNNQPINNYNNYNNQQPMNNNQQVEVPKKERNFKPLIVLLVLILLGVGGYFGYKYFIQKGSSVPTKKVSYDGYEFKIPEALNTQVNSNTLVAYNDEVVLSFVFINGAYTDFSSSLTLENFNSLGNKAEYMGEKEKNGNKYHLYKVTVSDKNTYIGYTASGVTKIVCFGVEPRTGVSLPKEEYLNQAIDAAMSATYNGSSNMETKVDTDSSVTTAAQALIGEESSTGDIDDVIYEDTYVNITLEEINE